MAYTESELSETVPVVRSVLEQIANKWSILAITNLCGEPQRFSALKRRLDGVTQKALADTLRRLERSGLIDRQVVTRSPIAVVYSITPLGRTLQEPLLLLYGWAILHQTDLHDAHRRYDTSQLSAGNGTGREGGGAPGEKNGK